MKVPSIENIELAIMNHKDFNFRQNLMVFRVTDISGVVKHECDCLIMSKAGYLTEIEIKRSYADFLADFRKSHTHSDPIIKTFAYMLHESFCDKAYDTLLEKKIVPSVIYKYNDDCEISIHSTNHSMLKEIGYSGVLWHAHNEGIIAYGNANARPLFIEEKLQLARLGAMRYKNMTEKLVIAKESIK